MAGCYKRNTMNLFIDFDIFIQINPILRFIYCLIIKYLKAKAKVVLINERKSTVYLRRYNDRVKSCIFVGIVIIMMKDRYLIWVYFIIN